MEDREDKEVPRQSPSQAVRPLDKSLLIATGKSTRLQKSPLVNSPRSPLEHKADLINKEDEYKASQIEDGRGFARKVQHFRHPNKERSKSETHPGSLTTSKQYSKYRVHNLHHRRNINNNIDSQEISPSKLKDKFILNSNTLPLSTSSLNPSVKSPSRSIEPEIKRRYQNWTGTNSFICGGVLMLGAHPWQLFLSVCLIIASYVAYFFLILPFHNNIWIYLAAFLSCNINLILLFATAFTEPGIYPRRIPIIAPACLDNSTDLANESQIIQDKKPNSDDVQPNLLTYLVGLVLSIFNRPYDMLISVHDKNEGGRSFSNSSSLFQHSASNATFPQNTSSSATTESFMALDQYFPFNEIKEDYCNICHVIHSQRTRHCKFCNNCVETFDHHCPVSHFVCFSYLISLNFMLIFI